MRLQVSDELDRARAGPLFCVAAKELAPGSFDLVRTERLELSRVAPLEPKSSASTSSATFATSGLPGTPSGAVAGSARVAARCRSEKVCLVGREGFEPSTY